MKFTLSNPEFKNPTAKSISKWITFARNFSLVLGVIQLLITPLIISTILSGDDGSAIMFDAIFGALTQIVYGTILILFGRKLKGDPKTGKFEGNVTPLNWLIGVSLGLAILSYAGGAPSAFLLFMHAVVCGRARFDIYKFMKSHTPAEESGK